MKPIIKVLLFMFTAVLLSQCEREPLPDTGPYVTIPDTNFLAALIVDGVDRNGDGLISYAEAKAIQFINVPGDSISNLTGIEKFINLISLMCITNQLTSIDISNNTKLVFLFLSDNQLTSLDVSNNTMLKSLALTGNQLTSLDVSNNTALESLGCGSNQLSTLDIVNNVALKHLYSSRNQLPSLDVSNNTALETLDCNFNQLTSLDVSKNTALKRLRIKDIPSLYKVCVWELPFPSTGVELDTTDSPNVYFTTDCSK